MAEFDDINESKGLGVPVHLYEFRGSDAADSLLENNVQSLILGPAHGAFALASSRVDYANGESNTAVGGLFGDLVKSVEQMEQKFPRVRHITITPAWFGTSLNASECLIGPRVGADYSPPSDGAQAWNVGGQLHGAVSVNTNPHWQGTPSDWAVRECIAYLKSKGFSVSVMPVLLMEAEGYPSSDLITGSLTDFMTQYTPFMTHYATLAKDAGADSFIAGKGLDGLIAEGAAAGVERLCGVSGADTFPSVGHIAGLSLECDGETPTEGTAVLGGVIRFTANSAWNGKFRIINNDFQTISSGTAIQVSGGDTGVQEWRIDGLEWDLGITRTRFLVFNAVSGSVFTPPLPANSFTFTFEGELTRTLPPPADTALSALITALAPIAPDSLGFALSPQNNLTPVGDLIANNDGITFIALTHTFPLSDWRRGKANLDRDNGFASQYSLDYLRHNLAGGEGYEWDYATLDDAATQTRTFDPAPTLENGRKYKDIRGWWLANVSRQTKPIVFVEIAYPSISYGTNPIDPDRLPLAPRDAIVYTDPQTGTISFASDRGCQRAGCEAVLSFYNNPDNNPDSPSYNAPMVDLTRSSVACWDARLYPYSLRPARNPATGADLDHPANPDLAADWETGLQLNGKVARPPLTASNLGKWYFTDYDEPITHNGNVYEPHQVKAPTITREGTLKTEPLGLGIPFNHPVAELLKDLRSQVPLVLTALRGHIQDDGTPTAFYPLWTGRVVANTRTMDSVSLDILPFSSVLERVGLTRAYTISCPHLLYGGQCKANIARATNKDQAVQSISGADLIMQWPVDGDGVRDDTNTEDRWNTPFDPEDFERGIIQFFDGTITHRRQIISVNGTDSLLLDTRMPPLAEAMAAYTASLETDTPLPQPVVDLILGCKHTLVDCEFLHNNLHNFGGAPKIPDKNPFSDQVRVFYRGL